MIDGAQTEHVESRDESYALHACFIVIANDDSQKILSTCQPCLKDLFESRIVPKNT